MSEPPVKSDKFKLVLSMTSYIHIKCVNCGADADVGYEGTDGTMPKIHLACPSCNAETTAKIFNPHTTGFPSSPR